MSGGILQLALYGKQDVFISGNPEITFFKTIYRRHTNFSIEQTEQNFSSDADFGKIATATIGKNGDLIHKMYLMLTLPALDQTQNGATWQGYVNSVGHSIIKRVDLIIGGQPIERHYGEWLEMWSELSLCDTQKKNFNIMIGKYESDVSLETNAITERTYYVPLQFWFCRNQGLALPLIALTQHNIEVKFEFRPLAEMVKSDVLITSPVDENSNPVSFVDASLLIDCIYLDNDERRFFAQQPHEYLIEQVQYQGQKEIDASTGNQKIRISFQNPVKELVWGITTDANLTTHTVTGNNYLKFSSTSGVDTFATLKIQFNGTDRFAPRKSNYFRTVQPHEHHSANPRKYVYCYSFAIKPEDHQPSGSVNMSRLNNTDFFFTFTQADVVDSKFKLFAISYNVARIVSGMFGLAY
jgi:hypothetical protein